MQIEKIDISSFSKSSTFYGEINALVTIKSFDLQAIRKRYIESRTNKGGKTGSVERRQPSVGGLANIKIVNSHLVRDDVLLKIKEPRALHIAHGKFSFAAENIVFVINQESDINKIENPWFSYVHTVQFHPKDSEKLLISSSGFDLILEYDLTNNQPSYEWLAWDNGFNNAIDPTSGQKLVLTRDINYDQNLLENDQTLLVISDPKTDALPTAKRAAFINSVVYDSINPDYLLATFFHEGAVYSIHTKTGKAKKVLSGLKNPHGGHRLKGKIVGTSTGSGEIHIQQIEHSKKVFSLTQISGKPIELSNMEWVQNTATYEGNFIAIDANRTSFVIFNPELELYDVVPFNDNWAVQDIAIGSINDNQLAALKTIN